MLARAIVRDVWQAQAAPTLALTVIGMLCSIVVSPMLGGLLTKQGGWQLPIFAALLVGLGALLAVLVLYKESNRALDPRAGQLRGLLGNYVDLLKGHSCRLLALALLFTYGAMFAVIAGSSHVYIGFLGLSSAEYGLVFGLIVSGLIAGAVVTRRLILQVGLERLVSIGVGFVAAGAVATLAIYKLLGLSVLGLSLPQVLVTFGGGWCCLPRWPARSCRMPTAPAWLPG